MTSAEIELLRQHVADHLGETLENICQKSRAKSLTCDGYGAMVLPFPNIVVFYHALGVDGSGLYARYIHTGYNGGLPEIVTLWLYNPHQKKPSSSVAS
jgi:hypothetical protein